MRRFYSVEYWHEPLHVGVATMNVAGKWYRSSGDFDTEEEAVDSALKDLQWRVIKTTLHEEVCAGPRLPE